MLSHKLWLSFFFFLTWRCTCFDVKDEDNLLLTDVDAALEGLDGSTVILYNSMD